MNTTRQGIAGLLRAVLVGLAIVGAAHAQPQAQEADLKATEGQQSSWWDESPWADPDRGFHWYPDSPKQRARRELEQREPRTRSIYEMTTAEEVEKEFKRLKSEAVLNPTEANVVAMLRAQAWIMDKSAIFTDVARRVVWATPDVNYNVRSPVQSGARAKAAERKAKDIAGTVRELAADHGLLFFARSDCPYCHDQAPILKAFEEATGMPVMAISMDGGPIPGFPEAKPDNGVAMKVSRGAGIDVVPALFLVHRVTRDSVPIGVGVLAIDEISERIRVVTKTKPGDDF
jgi:conjugal transfer pilus assembly protein TraF